MRSVAVNAEGVVNRARISGTAIANSCTAIAPDRQRAFTLVELLVVIGIIALLISVLLPALNKARQQANLIDCQSRLRQMGQALNIYAAENNGLLPYSDVRYDPTASTPWLAGAPAPSSAEFSWFWDFTLSQEIQANILGPDRLVHNLSPIFRDVDTIDATYGRYVNHYTCNPRIFHDNWEAETLQDGTAILPQYVKNPKLSNIKPSTAFLFWDAPQIVDYGPGNVAYEQATELDANTLTYGTYFFLGTTTSVPYVRPVEPGGVVQNFNASFCKGQQIKYNVDQGGVATPILDYFVSFLRFRHLNNTTLNALCVDGHVESRAVGTFMVLDVYINSPG